MSTLKFAFSLVLHYIGLVFEEIGSNIRPLTHAEWEQVDAFRSSFDTELVNPATGLMMVGSVDTDGNLYGASS